MTINDFPDIRLYKQDCIDGMRSRIPDDSVDVVVTSPPYNLGIEYSSYKDDMNRDDFLDWCMEWAGEVHRILKPDGSFFLNVAGSPKSPMFPHELVQRLQDEGTDRNFVLQNEIHWIKSIAIPGKKVGAGNTLSDEEVTIGHIKPINSPRFLNDGHEYVFHLTPHGNTKLDRLAVGVPYADKTNIDRWNHTNGCDLKCRGNVWYIPYKTIQNRDKDRPHPATFPVELAARCIKLHGNTGQSVVVDPFVGIGHAALAAIECRVREFIGFDLDGGYIKVAREEVRKLAPQHG